MTSADGFIARHPGHATHGWASPEEQALFFATIEAADWAVMGRITHLAADRPDRRRIVFSTAARRPEWRRPTQLWLDPSGLRPADLPALVAGVRPLGRGLVLGGTRVHDWFHAAGALASITLTIEPVRFGTGLPVFSGQPGGDPVAALASCGYRVTGERALNATGTRLVTLEPAGR